ncbi:hypothetical protein SELMODRAFT_427206 [Selaginella moellendorffii]|uniref:Uncharacterized protein n=1 Tax=Selaginella moellendorffii TaxID=88036 RepID=D8SYV2_SELML|nr:hypothetical protein SELMODRAFT_427206 [Selaginella moellendorffii]
MGLSLGGGLETANTPRKRRPFAPSRPHTAGVTAISHRPQTAPARPQSSPRKRMDRNSPYSPRNRFATPRSANLSRPQTAGEPFALNSSAWGMKPMPAGSPASGRSRGSDSSRCGLDRETLVKELVELKKLVADQNRQQKKQKLLASAVEHENRKLERDILDLELKGIADALSDYDSPFLREKLQDFKTRISYLQRACRLQSEELCLLRRDVRGTHTKELEMERDVFAEEAFFLQRVARKLATIQTRINSENKEIQQMLAKNEQLEAANYQTQSNITEVSNVLQKVTHSLSICRFKTSEASIASKRYLKQSKDVRRRGLAAEQSIQRLKDQKLRFQIRMSILEKKLIASKKELAIVLQERDKGRAARMKKYIEEQSRAMRSPRHRTPPRRSPKPVPADRVVGSVSDRSQKEKFGKKD